MGAGVGWTKEKWPLAPCARSALYLRERDFYLNKGSGLISDDGLLELKRIKD